MSPSSDGAGGSATRRAAAEDLASVAQRHLVMHNTPAHLYSGEGPRVFVKGDGIHLVDHTGERFMDGLAGLFCVQVGYSFGAEVGRAAMGQLEALPYQTNWSSAHPPAVELARRLAELAPGDLNRVFFASDGSGANEAAIKLVRQYHQARGEAGRRKFIARRNSYHGTSFGALSLTGITQIRGPFEPLMAGVRHVSDTSSYRLPDSVTPEQHTAALLEEIESVIGHEGAETVAGIVIEPVQGSGGCLVPPPGYLAGVRDICDRHGVLLVVDEVITAFGRLGAWFASERLNIRPDVLTFAKGITSGYAPLGGFICTDHVLETILDGPRAAYTHGVTFGGHPLSCTVALANLDILEREKLVSDVRAREDLFQHEVSKLLQHPLVGDVRGMGFWYTLELVSDKASKSWDLPLSAADFAVALQRELHEERLICRVVPSLDGTVLVIISPPLTIDDDEIADLVGRLGRGLDAARTRVLGRDG